MLLKLGGVSGSGRGARIYNSRSLRGHLHKRLALFCGWQVKKDGCKGIGMKGENKTKVQLTQELASLRQQVAELKALESQRKRTEEALQESQHFIERVANTTPNILYLYDLIKGCNVYANYQVSMILGYTPEKIQKMGATFLQKIIHPDDLLQFTEFTQRFATAKNGDIIEHEYRARHANGECRWLHSRDTVFARTADGLPQLILGTAQDITERKQAEEALKESEEKYHKLIETANDAIFIAEVETGIILEVNKKAEELLGLPAKNIVGKYQTELHPKEEAEHYKHIFLQHIESGKAISQDLFVCHRDGHKIPVEISASVTAVRGKKIIQGIFRNITERQRAKEALRESEERHRTIFATSPDYIYLTDTEGNILDANAALLDRAGLSLQQMQQKNFRDFFVGDNLDEILQAVTRLREGQEVKGLEVRAQNSRGEIFEYEVNAVPLKEQGEVRALLNLARDITERKRAEVELLKAKQAAEAADRAKSEFLATMSHELRTPLNIVMGYNDLLLERMFGDLTAEQVDTLWRINKSAHELLDLITAVLDLSRLEAGRLPVELKEIHVADIIKEVKAETQELCGQSGLKFGWRVERNLPRLHTDPGKLKVVIKNLVGNAVKFTEEGRVMVEAHRCDGGVEIRITDTGMGIPAEALPIIFEPFQQVDSSETRQHGGSGLGLHIVKRLLELLGGKIKVESKVKRGSTFHVWVPAGK